MTQEQIDFEFFKENQLYKVEFNTGRIDTAFRDKWGHLRTRIDTGSLNEDGYVRIWCNRRLRMKHRLLFWLYHGYLPEEVDHDDKVRNNNAITNLLDSTRSCNTTGKTSRTYKQLTTDQVHEICKIIGQGDINITHLAKQFGRSRTQIKGILSKKYWKEISDQYF